MKLGDSKDLGRVARILERHVSPIHARSILRRALSEHNVDPWLFTLADMAVVRSALREGLRLFTNDAVCERAQAEFAELTDGAVEEPEQPELYTLDISNEADISLARAAARKMCQMAGAKSFVAQKIGTIVSELTRNIVCYSHGGKLELQWKLASTGRRRLLIRATDTGPGIPHLSSVLAGEYKSKTGLGRGIIGCKRLATHFDISTGRLGTQVTVEVEV